MASGYEIGSFVPGRRLYLVSRHYGSKNPYAIVPVSTDVRNDKFLLFLHNLGCVTAINYNGKGLIFPA